MSPNNTIGNKLCLGTVQFGIPYGISNKTGQVPPAEVSHILRLALQADIRCLDTAAAYGDSEQVLGHVLATDLASESGNFRIISKYLSNDTDILPSLLQSCRMLNVDSLYGYLLHQFDRQVLENGVWDSFLREKAYGRIRKVGFSLYNPGDLDLLMDKKIEFDIVQLPFNVLDQRFLPYFGRLKEMGVEIHVRSAFLQGLLLLPPDKLPSALSALSGTIAKLRNFAATAGVPLVHLLLGFVHLQQVDQIVIGVESAENLKINSGYPASLDKIKAMESLIYDLACEDENLILPTKWKIT